MALIKVRYRGIADERTISKKDFASAGVNVEKDVTWNRRNNFAVVMEASDTAEELLRAQGHFRIEKINDDNSSDVVIEATDADNEGDVLVDGDTGNKTTAKKASAAKRQADADIPTGGSASAATGTAVGNGASTAGV
jgi:hypothetical protein